MKTVWLLISLLASTALAGPPLSRGDLLKDRQYRTNADQVLYVDPTGNDSNACTATGTAACLTIQGALNKSPKLLRHRLTVNVAAGNYAGFIVSGFTIDPSIQKATAGILVDGALADVTPTTGTATGTASAGTAGSGSTFGTLTDAAATWTVNDTAIVGKFVVITGGTGSGQVRVIVSNTATELTIAGAWTAPTGTSTYAIQSPSVIITSVAALIPRPTGTSDMAAAGVQVADNTTGASRVTLRNIGITIAASTGVSTLGTNVELIQIAISGGTSGTSLLIGAKSDVTLTTCSASSTTGPSLTIGAAGTVLGANTRFATTGATTTTVQVSGIGAQGRFSGCQFVGAVGMAVTSGAIASTLSQGSQCDCNSAATSVCFLAGAVNVSSLVTAGSLQISSAVLAVNLGVTNCSYGLMAAGRGSLTASSTVVVSGNGLTYGANSSYGGLIVLPTATTTITGGTAEISVDLGAATTTWVSLAASSSCLTGLGTMSRVCRL
jgi:hypothetical protein